MAVHDFFRFVEAALSTKPSLIMDGDTFRRISGWHDIVWNRKFVNNLAGVIVHNYPRYLSAAETFLDTSSGQERTVYLVCAVSEKAYYDAVIDLRRTVERDLRGKLSDQLVIRHHH